MKKIVFELLFFTFWCFVFIILMFKLIRSCEKEHRKLELQSNLKTQKTQIEHKKFKFEKPNDWFEDKSISQRKLETIDRIFEFKPID